MYKQCYINVCVNNKLLFRTSNRQQYTQNFAYVILLLFGVLQENILYILLLKVQFSGDVLMDF